MRRALASRTNAFGRSGLHLANLLIVTSEDGTAYSYVIDSGWFPGKIFPQSPSALRHHDRDGDGKTDFFDLPAIGREPSYRFGPKTP